ncbi:hypothetical protein MBLNU230_g7590t1 [Neophaeotheca triangularis]
MDTLDKTEWDVLISGTGLKQSLLALALSRSDKKILHVDANTYYGGDEAALSLNELENWVEWHASPGGTRFSLAECVTFPSEEDGPGKKLATRGYSISLAPQILYTRSNLLSALVSSRTHGQLEFQAVGSWFLLNQPESPPPSSGASVVRVPGGREDIFRDDHLDLRSKRRLMKFLQFVSKASEDPSAWQASAQKSLPTFLEKDFNLAPASHAPLLALTLSRDAPEKTTVEYSLPKIERHLRSIGVFGPGFGAVLPKWGGLAEIAQVACRAGAVGGGVYVLNKGIKSRSLSPIGQGKGQDIELADGERVTAQHVIAGLDDFSAPAADSKARATADTYKSVSVVSSPLAHIFPPVTGGGITPAAAMVFAPASTNSEPPVYISAHSSDSGECPTGQCVMYASLSLNATDDPSSAFERLHEAVAQLLSAPSSVIATEETAGAYARVLWRLQYVQHTPVAAFPDVDEADKALQYFAPMAPDLALEDDVLEEVKGVWRGIVGDEADDEEFLKFEPRQAEEEDEM